MSEARLDLSRALDLSLFATGGLTLIEHLTLVIVGGRIERVLHPVPSPEANASDVIDWLSSKSGAVVTDR